MNLRKVCLTLFVSVFAVLCYGQNGKDNYDLSAPLDLPQSGWNKTLCMKNGNTLLFHFEQGKKILVKVFDSAHKEIASRKDEYATLDVFNSFFARFKGLFEVNGEAVLFIDQDHAAKHQLVRMRYSATDGHLIEDKLVAESRSENKRILFYVMKNKEDDNYEILFFTDIRHPKSNETVIRYYNNKHGILKDLNINIDTRKKYDYCQVVGAESQPNGIFITVDLTTIAINGKLHESANYDRGGAVYNHVLQFIYVPKDTAYIQKTSLVDAGQDVFPYYSIYTHNSFANNLNLLLFSYSATTTGIYLGLTVNKISSDLFFDLDEQSMTPALSMLRNSKATAALQEKTDTSHRYKGFPYCMFTNENGLTTLFSEPVTEYGEPETRVRYNYEDYFGNIGITQVDDNGKEIWGTVLPVNQYYKSYASFYPVSNLAKRWQSQAIFGNEPPQVYNRQFVSVNTYCHGKDFYIVYNDYDTNFNNSIENPGDTVYTFENTNACYYKMDSKKEITKSYLFGKPAAREYKCSFIEGACFDEKRGVYAALVQCKQHGKITLRMGWSHLQ